ncbi:LOW QUALITY PROTEIN: aluminum-activated malate transporter 10-like [Curcuma longa]|uniref:LOW QUALITY PROTEIN: aluminum-activated malate transporter 10-like n=1 Tax=Curcuma longa TaxID=136217 RepID=UPI003D9DCC08
MDTSAKEVQGGGVEWRVRVPQSSSVVVESQPWAWLAGIVLAVVSKAVGFGGKAWSVAADDPRRVVHGVKVGTGLTLVSLFYYTRPLYDGVGGWAMWAVMTVVVVFEYTVGGCLCKGFNRAIATSTAGLLAVGIHWVASKSGEKAEPVILSASVFILASAATFSRFIPAIKARFDYGITIFILTFSLVAVSGYRVDQLLQLAQERVYTISIGVGICLLVCVLVCPVWAGQELHLLVSGNLEKLADSLEGLVEECFMADEAKEEGKQLPSAKSQGYKCVLNSKATEDSQANLAKWEPGHGRFRFRHPWSQYLKVAAAMRYCAYCMEAFNGCISSETTEDMKSHLRESCVKLSSDSSKILRELSSSIKSMKESRSIQSLVVEMKNGVQELQVALRSLPTNHVKKHRATVSLMEAMPVVTAASLLIEVSDRIEGVVEAVGLLGRLASFEPTDRKKASSSPVVPQDESVRPQPQEV